MQSFKGLIKKTDTKQKVCSFEVFRAWKGKDSSMERIHQVSSSKQFQEISSSEQLKSLCPCYQNR